MKIVCFTEIEKGKEYGLFLATCSRLLAMQEKGIKIELYSLRKYHSGLWAIIRKLLRLDVKKKELSEGFYYKNLKCSYLPYPETISGYILEKSGCPQYTLQAIYKAVSQIDYDYIIAHWGLEPAYFSMMLSQQTGKPFTVYYHGSDINATPPCWRKPQNKILQNAGCNIFVSEVLLRKALCRNYTINNTLVSHNGWENEKAPNENHLRKENVVLFAGALEKVKGADLLPDIAKAVYKENCNVEFIIAGTGSLYEQIEKELLETKIKFQMIGRIEHSSMIALMKEVSVLIAPSRNEGLSLILLESIATNTPIVATELDSTSYILESEYLISNPETIEQDKYIDYFSTKVLSLLQKPEVSYRYKVKTWEEVVKFELERISRL